MFCRTTFQNQNSRLQRFLAPGPRRLLPLQLCQDMLTITYDEITNGVQQIQCFSAECVLIHRQRHFVQQQSKTMSKLPCKSFFARNSCESGDRCPFSHATAPTPAPANACEGNAGHVDPTLDLAATFSSVKLDESEHGVPWSLDIGVLFSIDSMRTLFGRYPSSEYFLMPRAPSLVPHPTGSGPRVEDVLRGSCNIWPQYLHCSLVRVASSSPYLTKGNLVNAIEEFCSADKALVYKKAAQVEITSLSVIKRRSGDLFVANVSVPEQILRFSAGLSCHLREKKFECQCLTESQHVTFAKKKYEKKGFTNWDFWQPIVSSKCVFPSSSESPLVLEPTQVGSLPTFAWSSALFFVFEAQSLV